MFGHQNSTDDSQSVTTDQATAEPTVNTASDVSSIPINNPVITSPDNDGPILTENSISSSPIIDDTSASSNSSGFDLASLSSSDSVPDLPAIATPDDEPSSPNDNLTDNLLDIKKQALEQLTPLVNELDQSSEEKFRTTMMMIQASDNQSLIKDAYEAALNITDEKTKAQALLDLVNEINYFTQQHDS